MASKFIIFLIAAIICSVAADTFTPVTGVAGAAPTANSYPYIFPLADGTYYYGYGGTGANQFIYNYTANAWKNATTTGAVPPSGYFAGSQCTSPDGKKEIVFGGAISSRVNDVYLFDLTTLVWTKGATQTPANVPPRNLAQCLWLPSNKVLFFGGKDGNNFLNDLLEYDVATDAWTTIFANGNSSSPVARSGAVSVANADYSKWFIFTGFTVATNPATWTNNLAVLDIATKTWVYNQNITAVTPRIDTTGIRVADDTWKVLGGATTGNVVTVNLTSYEVTVATAASAVPGKSGAFPLNSTSWILVSPTINIFSVDAPEESTSTDTEESTTTDTEESTTTDTEESTSSDSDSSSDDDTETATESSTVTDDNSGQAIIVPCVALLVSAIAALF